MDLLFKALADPSRRALLERLVQKNGQTMTELCAGAAMSRQAVTKHLSILKRADLVIPLWRGRHKLHYLNPVPICEMAKLWMVRYEGVRTRSYLELKKGLEENRPKHL